MMKRPLCFFLLAFVFSSPAAADALFVGSGPGLSFSSYSTTNVVRYQREAGALLGLGGFYEAAFASWNGPNHNEAGSLARGIRWAESKAGSFSLTAGLGRVERTTANLGQPFEFYGRLAYDLTVGAAAWSVGWTHYSDAKFLFGWSGPNNAENFLTLSFGVLF
jgi:hypothetical protein